MTKKRDGKEERKGKEKEGKGKERTGMLWGPDFLEESQVN